MEAPLWDNVNMAEICHLEGFQLWKAAGICNISQIFNNNVLKSFTDIQTEFNLPKHQFYKYLQLRHAIQTQGRTSTLILSSHPLIKDIFYDQKKKGLISHIYSSLLASVQDPAALQCRRGWTEDLGEITDET